MDSLRNKPRVFLSHSKADINFIQRLYDDLRHCQIDPWLDSQEIRHGEAWLDAIFASGIPTCDCVLVYLTENSIESNIVKKEIDASIIRKLKDNQVAFFPYVSHAEIRDKLRTDIQSLQVPEWNENNYHLMLPRVVAEIWRGHLDRAIIAATNEEKVKRLQAELTLAKLEKEAAKSIFSEGEDKDFAFIQKSMDRWETVIFLMTQPMGESEREVIQEARYSVNVLALVLSFVRDGYHSFAGGFGFSELLPSELYPLPEDIRIETSQRPEMSEVSDELIMFGLIQEESRMKHSAFHKDFGQETVYQLEFTNKMHRFRYWLTVNKLMPDERAWRPNKPFERMSP